MANKGAKSVDEYLASMPADRREAIAAVRQIVLDNLPAGYEEGMQFGMIGYYVPLARYPKTYNGQPLGYAALGSHKSYMTLYLNSVYADEASRQEFERDYAAAGKKLDMGKSCVHFKRLDDLPLELIGRTIASTPLDDYVRLYEASRRGRG
ncbi:MAG: DUF1801 domain-containing protein [Candidatus Promineifilaceae bacterium]